MAVHCGKLKCDKNKKDPMLKYIEQEYSKMPPSSFFQRCIRPFFFSKHSDYLKAPYFWASVMLLLTVCTIIKILCGYPEYTPLAGIETGLSLGLIAVYNQGNKNANNLPK